MNANDEMVEGYRDGRASDLEELPAGSNRSESYVHGWRNGRDDRVQRPRAAASQLRDEATEIEFREGSYL
jgi:ribosome modulation factor